MEFNNSRSVPGQLRRHKRSSFENVDCFFQKLQIPRTTRLDSPVERLEDHNGEVFTCEFHPNGELLLSGGIRKQIHICSVYGKCTRVMVLKGHWCAIMEAHFSEDGSQIFSCSSDKTLGVWDTFTGTRISRLKGHFGCVNSVQCAGRDPPILCSGSDDATVRLWDVRQEMNPLTFNNMYNVTAVCFNETSDHIFVGGLEADIKILDIRMGAEVLRLHGHRDAVTGVALSPCGSYLLSHSIDNTLRVWDIRPAFAGERCIRIFDSNQQIVNGNLLRCAWSPDGSKVSAGSCEEGVPIWSMAPGAHAAELPGHDFNVNDVDFHPRDPLIASAGSDSYLFLHELKN